MRGGSPRGSVPRGAIYFFRRFGRLSCYVKVEQQGASLTVQQMSADISVQQRKASFTLK